MTLEEIDKRIAEIKAELSDPPKSDQKRLLLVRTMQSLQDERRKLSQQAAAVIRTEGNPSRPTPERQ